MPVSQEETIRRPSQWTSGQRLNCAYHATLLGLFDYLFSLDEQDVDTLDRILNPSPESGFLAYFNNRHGTNLTVSEFMTWLKTFSTPYGHSRQMIQALAPTLRYMVHEHNAPMHNNGDLLLEEQANSNCYFEGVQSHNVFFYLSAIFGIDIQVDKPLVFKPSESSFKKIAEKINTYRCSGNSYSHMMVQDDSITLAILLYWGAPEEALINEGVSKDDILGCRHQFQIFEPEAIVDYREYRYVRESLDNRPTLLIQEVPGHFETRGYASESYVSLINADESRYPARGRAPDPTIEYIQQSIAQQFPVAGDYHQIGLFSRERTDNSYMSQRINRAQEFISALCEEKDTAELCRQLTSVCVSIEDMADTQLVINKLFEGTTLSELLNKDVIGYIINTDNKEEINQFIQRANRQIENQEQLQSLVNKLQSHRQINWENVLTDVLLVLTVVGIVYVVKANADQSDSRYVKTQLNINQANHYFDEALRAPAIK
jgi:hypothetical protein